MQELLTILLAESGLNAPDLHEYDVNVWDEEFEMYAKYVYHFISLLEICWNVVCFLA